MGEGVDKPRRERTAVCEPSRFGVFSECPHCAGPMQPEHAHFRCGSCGWRDSCCD